MNVYHMHVCVYVFIFTYLTFHLQTSHCSFTVVGSRLELAFVDDSHVVRGQQGYNNLVWKVSVLPAAELR